MTNKIIKTASLITALTLACCNPVVIMPHTAYAAEQSTQAEAFITVPEGTFASNGMFTVTYDPQKVTVTDAKAGDMITGGMNIANIKNGKVTFAFVNTKPMDISGNILKITYETDGSPSPFSLKINELITLDEKGNELGVDRSGISIAADTAKNEPEFSLSCSSSGSTVKATLSFPENTDVTNGVIVVNYDEQKLKYLNGSAESSLENGMFEINKVSEGQIKIAFINTKAISGGEAFSLNFEALSKYSQISAQAEEFFYTDANGESTSITVKPASCSVEADDTAYAKLSISLPGSYSAFDPPSNITASVNIPEKTGVTNGVLTLSYNPEEVSISKSVLGGSLENAMVEINEISEGVVKIAFINPDPINEKGWISFDLTGKKDCFTTVQINADEFLATGKDGVAVPIPVESGSAYICILSSIKYDINGDGTVSSPDLIALRNCIFSPESVTPEVLKRADLNNNDTVNVFDMIRLKNYLLS